jgi:membrane-bound serine protease (ClpP class)
LTLTAGEMERYCVSSATVESLEALLQLQGIPSAEVKRLALSVPDKIVIFLTSAAVTSILVLIGLVAIYLEISSPGFGVPGTVAIIAFATIFIGGALLGTVGSLEIIMFLVGVVLLVVEIFLIPGFGATGITGIVLMVLALVLSRQEFIVPRFSWQWGIFLRNLRNVGLGFFGSLVAIVVLMRVFHRTPLLKRLILSETQASSAGYTAQSQDSSASLVGRRGAAVTTLRPAGKAEFDGEVLAVETDGEFIERGSAVEIFEVSGNRILVRRC